MSARYAVVALAVEDYDAVCAVWTAAGLAIRPQGRDSRAEFAAQMAGGTQLVFGVRADDGDSRAADGALVGVVVATHDGRKGWINRLAVHPDYRHQGLGQQLIAAAEQALQDRGLRIIAALVEADNAPSLALFERAGYQLHTDIYYLTKRDSHEV